MNSPVPKRDEKNTVQHLAASVCSQGHCVTSRRNTRYVKALECITTWWQQTNLKDYLKQRKKEGKKLSFSVVWEGTNGSHACCISRALHKALSASDKLLRCSVSLTQHEYFSTVVNTEQQGLVQEISKLKMYSMCWPVCEQEKVCICLAKIVLVALRWPCLLQVIIILQVQSNGLMKIKFLDSIIWTVFQNKGNSSTIALGAGRFTMTLIFQELCVLQMFLFFFPVGTDVLSSVTGKMTILIL